MLYKRLAEYGDTFRIKIEIAKNQPNQFFHIFLSCISSASPHGGLWETEFLLLYPCRRMARLTPWTATHTNCASENRQYLGRALVVRKKSSKKRMAAYKDR
jgi:hypothetical protein